MRQNLWRDDDARSWADAAGPDEADRLLAERVYTSRLIGADPDLVMHGGGNTSVKLRRRDLLGAEREVLHVKGSGWDLDTLLAPGLPGVWLEPLRALRDLDRLSDEDMVNVQRANLLDTGAPNPSVETLLHAYLPHRYVDHTHATAFLALANLPDAARVVAELFEGRLAVVPYIMPGFALAKEAAEVFEAQPDCEGLVLLNHGHFTFGATAKESYDRTIAQTNVVEEFLARRASGRTFARTVRAERAPLDPARARAALPALRGAVARLRGEHHDAAPRPAVSDVRAGERAAEFLSRGDLAELSRRGTASPDHVIRTKGRMLVLSREDATDPARIEAQVRAYAEDYRAMFERQNARVGGGKVMLEPHPCVVWLEGAGLVGIGKDARAASAAADIAEQTIEVMTLGEAAGGYHPNGEDDLFDCEYWSLEQAKLKKAADRPFTGRVVAVTGGAGAIGRAVAEAFAAQGAAVALIDRDGAAAQEAAAGIGAGALAVTADLAAQGAAEAAIGAVVERFGGLDILISNAGAATPGDILTMPEAEIRAAFELNFFSHLAMARAAAQVFEMQGIGGQMLFNASKQAINPGRNFGAYGLPKATTFFLVRQLALELGEKGVRVNGVNADRIRSGLLSDDMIARRAGARGVSEAEYMAGNLLKREVEARHVADAFVALAGAERTTAHVMTVDGGNVEAALR